MKKQFTTFLMSAAMMVVAAAFTACSSDVENPVKSNDGIEIPEGKSLFTSGETAGMPVINADADGEAKAMSLNGDGTRTSMGGKAVSQKFPFYWEPGDKIWVKNSNYKQSAPTSITSTQPSAQFMLDGIYSAPRYEVYYTGQNSPQAASSTANALQVTIADQQVQDGWNNSKHLGTSGDCGSCYANLQGNGSYTFSMDHKASYLIFYPYLHTALSSGSYSLQKIEIYSDAGGSTIAGTYDFTFADGLADTPQAGTAKQAITLTCGDAFGLTTAVPDLTTSTVYNHCFVVIAPGTHQLTIKYTLKNMTTNVEYHVYKDIDPKVYAENSVYTFIHELRYFEEVSTFKFRQSVSWTNRYAWGATRPRSEAGTNSAANASGVVGDLNATNNFWKDVPNMAAMTYYSFGCGYNDNSITWTMVKPDGTEVECRGGVWLKKKAYLASTIGFSTTTKTRSDGALVNGRPDPSERSNYFFLPRMSPDGVANPNMTIRFWTSTSYDVSYAYCMEIGTTSMNCAPMYLKVNAWLCYPLNVDGTPWFQ